MNNRLLMNICFWLNIFFCLLDIRARSYGWAAVSLFFAIWMYFILHPVELPKMSEDDDL